MPTIGSIAKPLGKVLGYGDSGAGKTTFGVSMAKTFGEEKSYIMNFEPEYNLLPYMTAGLTKVAFDNYKIGQYDAMLKKIVDLKRMTPFPYDFVHVDGGNSMHKLILADILSRNNRSDSDGARIQDWGLAAERMKSRINEILELPCWVYMTFHEQLEKDELSGKVKGKILVSGKFLPDEIPALFNMFFHFIVKPVAGKMPVRMIATAPDFTYPAGDKTGALSFEEEPDFSKIYIKIQEQFKKGGFADANRV